MSALLQSLLVLLFYILGVVGAVHALLKAREPRSALIWMAICLFIPFFGVLAYAVFGVNRVKKVSQNWHSRGFSQIGRNEDEEHRLLSMNLPKAYKTWVESGDRLMKSPIREGCNVTPLFDGTEAYPAMLKAIDEAQDSVFLVTYIFSSNGFGAEFIEALHKAVERKVEVKVLIDGLGALYTWPSTYRRLKKLHVPVRLFLSPLHSFRGFMFMNLRNHAKILTIDGKVGFTGGMNILDKPIHDLHFKCEGPIVGSLQDTFLNLWHFSEREHERPRVLFYDDASKGTALVRGIDNGAYQDFPHILLRLITAINEAKTHVRIMTPYFVIGNVLGAPLIAARMRGVQIEIIMPEENNLSFVKGATEAGLSLLLKYGIKFYYRQGEFAHSKVAMIDDIYVFLGSSNLDTRSFLLNFEFNLEVYDQSLAKELITHFTDVKATSRQITNNWLQNRNFIIKLRNAFCKLFSPYL